MDKKTQLIAGGAAAGLLVIGGIAFALQGGSPKDQFIKRMTERAAIQKVGSKYEVSFDKLDMGGNPYASFLEDFKISGESHTNGTNVDLTVEFSPIFGQELPKAHFIYANKESYVNADLLPKFLTLYADFTGAMGAAQVANGTEGKFIELEKFIELTSGKQEAETFRQEMEGNLKNQTAFQKEMQDALVDYLMKVDDQRYSAKDNNLILVLQKEDIKGFTKAILTAMVNSKHYDGDKASLKESLAGLDEQYKNTLAQLETFDIKIALDKTKYDSQVNIQIEEADAPIELDLKFSNKEISYKEPKAPSKDSILSEKEIQKLMEKIGNMTEDMVSNFSTTTN